VALWRHEIAIPITTTRGLIEERDGAWIARLLLESAAFEFDRLILSAKGGVVRGLLHKIVPAWPRLTSKAMTDDFDGLIAKLGRHGAPGARILFIAAPPQADTLNRSIFKSPLHSVRSSAVLAPRTVIAAAAMPALPLARPLAAANALGG
jgi:hypothetical protein